jgi:hypothetical protein
VVADLPELTGQLVASLDALCAADPKLLADGDTVRLLYTQLERLSAVTTRATAAFDAGGEWAVDGARSAAMWIATGCRLPKASVQRRVRLGRELRRMSATEAAWLAGSLSDAHVALLAAARNAAPEAFERDEEMLVAQAGGLRHDQFCRVMAYWRQLNDPDGSDDLARRDDEARRAHLSAGLRGTGMLDALFNPIGFAVFQTAFERIERELFEADWAEARERLGDQALPGDLRRTPAQRRHDALVEMARRSGAVPADARMPEPLFSVVVDYESFARVCETAKGAVVTPGCLVSWLSDAWVERVVFGPPDRPINLGERRRLFTGALRRLIQIRDRECYHPYCDVPADACEIDHIQPWAQGGPTTEANGRCACPFHNRLRNPPPPDPPAAPP